MYEKKKNTNKNNNHNNKTFWNTQCTTYHIILIVNRMDDYSDCAIFHDWLTGCLFQTFIPNDTGCFFRLSYIVYRMWGKYNKYHCVVDSSECIHYTQMNALHSLSTMSVVGETRTPSLARFWLLASAMFFISIGNIRNVRCSHIGQTMF